MQEIEAAGLEFGIFGRPGDGALVVSAGGGVLVGAFLRLRQEKVSLADSGAPSVSRLGVVEHPDSLILLTHAPDRCNEGAAVMVRVRRRLA